MGEVLFYQLTTAPLERSLPELLAKSLERGWKVLVRAGSAARVGALDDMLWTYDDMAFLPHGTKAMDHAAAQPVYLTDGSENPNGASILMLVDGARVDCGEVDGFDRVCLIFNGNEAEAKDAARADWKAVTEAGLTAVYWAQEDGRWVEKARAG